MNPLLLFWRAGRRFGFWRTLLVSIVLLVFLSLAVQAFAAPPRPIGTPPSNPAYPWGLDSVAFDGTTASLCRRDDAFCPATMNLEARVANARSRYNIPLLVQLRLTVEASQCMEITCGDTLTTPAQYRPVVAFLDGHRLSTQRVEWHFTDGWWGTQADGSPSGSGLKFVGDPLPFGFVGFCGWHRLNFGILGDRWNGSDGLDARGNPIHYGPTPAAWAFAVPLAFYAGDCAS